MGDGNCLRELHREHGQAVCGCATLSRNFVEGRAKSVMNEQADRVKETRRGFNCQEHRPRGTEAPAVPGRVIGAQRDRGKQDQHLYTPSS